MKTLVKNEISIYLFEDDESILMTENNITVGNPAKFIIGDCNSDNTELFENVDSPEDWTGHRYMFDGENWTVNPKWPEDMYTWDGKKWIINPTEDVANTEPTANT